MRALFSLVLVTLCVNASADDWGSIKGRIVFDGDVPEKVLIHKKGAAGVKDGGTCAANDVYKEDLVINAENKGIANVFVYVYKPKNVWKGEEDLPEQVTFDQEGCVFKPHAMVVRAGQTIEVLNSDPIAHNTHTYTIKNEQKNLVVSPNTAKGKGVLIETSRGESVPSKVGCDYHTYMQAYWFIVDHPYAAVTDKDGYFTIKNLPAGDVKFRVWHEKPGYVTKSYVVDVKKSDEPLEIEPLKVKMEDLK